MLGKKSVLNSLEARRQALVAESEVNRTQFNHEWAALKQEVARLTTPMRKTSRYISSGMKVLGAFSALRKVWSQTHDANGKRNWIATLVQTARIGISLWPAFRVGVR
jgi:hypothetical protein